MTKVGFTGHQKLNASSAWIWLEANLSERLCRLPQPLVGITSLAIGSDQLFARLVLRMGGQLHCVLPFRDYERTFDADDVVAYRSLLMDAQMVETLVWRKSDEASYMGAGKRVVDLCDQVFAVWDGKPAKGLGGTADAVRYALDIGKAVTVFDPDACQIESRTQKI